MPTPTGSAFASKVQGLTGLRLCQPHLVEQGSRSVFLETRFVVVFLPNGTNTIRTTE